MTALHVFTNGTRGDLWFGRAVWRALLDAGHDLTIAVCRGDEELVLDLAGPRCRIVAGPLRNTVHGAVFDLGCLAGPGRAPLPLLLGPEPGAPTWQWGDAVGALNEQLAALGVRPLALAPEDVPMPGPASAAAAPARARAAVWVDTARANDASCHFVCDLERLARALPDHDLLCTAPPAGASGRVVDVGRLTWCQRSRLSEHCDALIGITREPFCATLTEANRWKPKALCGHDARVTAPFWDYPGNPLELLASMDELVDFVLAHVVEAGRR